MGLSGCATAELEERNFPIEMAVSDMEQFDREWLNADESGNRMVDYSHMKVILLDQKFLEDAQNMDAFLEILEKKSDVPRNTYLAVAEDAEAVLKLQKNMEESVGTYLEDYFENVSEIKKTAYPTLGMLYQEQENKMETLFIPYVEEVDQKPAVTKYYVWKRGEAEGMLDSQTALLSFFTQNQKEEYALTLADGVDVRLFAPHNQVVFSQTKEKQIIAEISCSGEILYEKPGWRQKLQSEYGQNLKSGDIKKMLEKELEDYFQQTAQKVEVDCAKNLSEQAFLEEAKEIQKLCREYKVPFIINDNVDLALEIDADGVHVGQDDMEAGEVRKRLGEDKIIGVSAHSVEEALRAEKCGATYLGSGAVFGSGTKKDVGTLDHEVLKEICAAVQIPVVAIGGISRDNILQLKGTGIDGVAVISAIFAQKDIRAAAQELRKLSEEVCR